MRTLLLLALASCTLAGSKTGDEDDDDATTDTTDDGVADASDSVDVSGDTTFGDDDDDDDDDGIGDLTPVQFLNAYYDGGCESALACNSSAKIIDLFCNTDVYDYFDGYTNDCTINQELAVACLDGGWSCTNDYIVPNSNACEPALDCGF